MLSKTAICKTFRNVIIASVYQKADMIYCCICYTVVFVEVLM